MALTKRQKEEILEQYGGGLASTENAFVVGYQGTNVPAVTELRAKIREVGGHYEVVKNTLARRAISGQPLEQLGEHIQGPTAIAYTSDDPVALAKALDDFAKTAPTIVFKAGLVEGRPVAAEEIAAIAELPSRDELLAKLLYLLQSPITNFVRVMAAVPRDFVSVLNQIAEKRGDGN